MAARPFVPASFVLGPTLLAVAASAACNIDPVHTNAVNALGPEVGGIPQGEFHRAGQPCTTCHGDEGPAKSSFTIGGTVFYGPANTAAPVGVGNVSVTLEDDSGSQFTTTTNCVGNFWVSPGDWPGHPQFPVLVTISGTPAGSYLQQSMQSHIGRQGSCAACHQIPNSDNLFETPGVVHLSGTDDPNFAGDQSCAVSPVLRAH